MDGHTACEALQATAAAHPDRPAIRTRGDEFTCSWGEYAARVQAIAGGLAAGGVRRGDAVALMLVNRPEFHFADSAVMHLGGIPFSIYNTYTEEQIAHLLRDSAARVVITEQAHVDKILAARDAVEGIEQVVVVDGEPPAGATSLDELAAGGALDFDFEAAWRAVQPDDVLTLIYTSGTTGPPKGVQITHANICETVRSYDELIQFPDGGRIVSYLPMAHVAERNVSHYLPMLCGFTATCCPDAREVMAYLPEVRPTWFFAVPRIWEKLKAGLEQMLAAAPAEERGATQAALESALQKVRLEQSGEPVPDELAAQVEKADDRIFSKLRGHLGLDQVEACNVGAAPTPPEVIEFFHALGIPLSELWGMSETTGAGTCNPPERIKIGTIGPPAPGVEIKLAEDREIMIRGPVVMKGYRNLPEKTAEAFTEDGFLLTGDIGEFDEDGYLRIVDRKKELIITAQGKNLSPANIEARLKQIPLVSQAVAIGDRRKYIGALLTLDPEAARGWAKQNGVEGDLATLSESEELRAEVQRGLDVENRELARVEQVKRFAVLPADWEPGGDELTPTMKLKRKPIAEKYADEIESLYAD
ncbi:MAG: long-chain fatty acid--CoA ligase [Actinobacteria bacterium 13_1_20CM_3_68_9]|nr:MAG: long-chain fatty acid--CoA ligase [Actinobacteria bacterium 13_1_20CM_3_68_9]